MNDLLNALREMGLGWEEVWRLTLDRQTGQVVVVASDGRKFTGLLVAPEADEPPPRRVKAIKRVSLAAGSRAR